jgi:ABC-type bacteriocin/lantibiotic exporter with double-glycine peptidase domain
MQTIKKLIFLLNSHERKKAYLLLIMILVMALIDMMGVASILPFMTILTDPSLIETNFILKRLFKIFSSFGVTNNQQFLTILGLCVFMLLIFSLAFKALTTYFQILFVNMLEYSIGKRLVEGYLHQPYSWFLSRNSADLGKTILSEVQQIIGNGLRPLLGLITQTTVVIALITLLIIADPKLAIIVGFSLISAYGFIFYCVQRYLNRTGEERLKNNRLRFLAVNEAFSAAKEVKVGGLEESYIKSFSNSAKIFAQSQASEKVIRIIPRYLLEAIAFGGILLIILYMMTLTGNFNSAVPIVSLYAFAGFRLMPALQQIYASFTQLTFVGPAADKLYSDLNNLKPFNENQDQGILPFDRLITLKNIQYNYPNAERTALKNINLSIPVKSTVGLVGATGSGKTTLVDIILGLLEAQQGTLEVDGKVITNQNSRSWQRSIGYVPQHIYLSDDTVLANIAFGVKPKDINHDLVKKAAKIANLHNFVIDELPKQYQTTIGERGVRLSGGQRQRIGIARALYHKPKVLILDEATSALDNETEKAVMDEVRKLSKDITIILIAHRLNTVKNCDIIFKLDKGQLTDTETFNKLFNNKNNGLTP